MKKGLSPYLVSGVARKLDVSQKDFLEWMDIPTSTFHRRQINGLLSTEESERLRNLCELIDAIAKALEEPYPLIAEWLETPSRRLDGKPPAWLLDSRSGRRLVYDVALESLSCEAA